MTLVIPIRRGRDGRTIEQDDAVLRPPIITCLLVSLPDIHSLDKSKWRVEGWTPIKVRRHISPVETVAGQGGKIGRSLDPGSARLAIKTADSLAGKHPCRAELEACIERHHV